jgi:hypothetical protein
LQLFVLKANVKAMFRALSAVYSAKRFAVRLLRLINFLIFRRTTDTEQPTIYKQVINKLNLASRTFSQSNAAVCSLAVLLAFSVAGALLCFASIRDTTRKTTSPKARFAEMDAEVKRA